MPISAGGAVGAEYARRRHEEHPEMDDGDPAFHAFKVGPETAKRIDADEVGHESDEGKNGDAYGKSIEFGTILCVEKCQDDPAQESDLYQNTEIETFAGNERKEERIGDYERKDRYEE